MNVKQKIKLENPASVMPLLERWKNRRQENFLIITFDGAHNVIGLHHILKGLANKTVVHPREVFYPLIKDNAVAFIAAHNHPSGRTYPSPEDDDITRNLGMAADIMGFHFIDHIIVGARSPLYYSYAEHGNIKNNFSTIEKQEFIEGIAAERTRKED